MKGKRVTSFVISQWFAAQHSLFLDRSVTSWGEGGGGGVVDYLY